MSYELWTAHGSLSATAGAGVAALCCAAVILAAAHGGASERLKRPALLLCLTLAIAMAIFALSAVPAGPDDLAKAAITVWGIVLARRLRALLIRFTRGTWWSPSP